MPLRLVLVYFTTEYAIHSYIHFCFYHLTGSKLCYFGFPFPSASNITLFQSFIIGKWCRTLMKTPLYCSLPLLPPLFFQILSKTPQPCSFCCLVSLAESVIMSHLMYYFAQWQYGPKLVELWYLSTSSTLLCVLFIKASNLLKIWHWWHGFSGSIICYCTHRKTHTGHTRIIDWHADIKIY